MTMKSKECMLCWDAETKEVKVVPWPDSRRLSERFFTVGACNTRLHEWSRAKIQAVLLAEGLSLIHEYNMPPEAVWKALLQIEECRELLAGDPFHP